MSACGLPLHAAVCTRAVLLRLPRLEGMGARSAVAGPATAIDIAMQASTSALLLPQLRQPKGLAPGQRQAGRCSSNAALLTRTRYYPGSHQSCRVAHVHYGYMLGRQLEIPQLRGAPSCGQHADLQDTRVKQCVLEGTSGGSCRSCANLGYQIFQGRVEEESCRLHQDAWK